MSNIRDPNAVAPPLEPIVTDAPRSFWSETIKAVTAFLVAQVMIALGLPFDDWASGLAAQIGIDLSPAAAWWVAASVLAAGLYLATRGRRRAPALNKI